MYHIPIKNWMHHVHIPKRHDVAIKLDHIVHDERFWAIVGAAILLGLLITMAVLTATSENSPPIVTPVYPFMP